MAAAMIMDIDMAKAEESIGHPEFDFFKIYDDKVKVSKTHFRNKTLNIDYNLAPHEIEVGRLPLQRKDIFFVKYHLDGLYKNTLRFEDQEGIATYFGGEDAVKRWKEQIKKDKGIGKIREKELYRSHTAGNLNDEETLQAVIKAELEALRSQQKTDASKRNEGEKEYRKVGSELNPITHIMFENISQGGRASGNIERSIRTISDIKDGTTPLERSFINSDSEDHGMYKYIDGGRRKYRKTRKKRRKRKKRKTKRKRKRRRRRKKRFTKRR